METNSISNESDLFEETPEDPSSLGDDEEDEEDVEPKLKYERLANDIGRILKTDAARCISVHPKVNCYAIKVYLHCQYH